MSIRNGALLKNNKQSTDLLFAYAILNIYLFSKWRIVVSDAASRHVSGSEFHNIWPATAKARSAKCRRCEAGISCKCADDRKSQHRGTTVNLTIMSDKYFGANPWMDLQTTVLTLNCTLCATGNQCSSFLTKSVIGLNLERPETTRAAVLINIWSRCNSHVGQLMYRALQ